MIEPRPGDALVVVDVQNDFLPGGALGVEDGDAVIEPLNHAIGVFAAAGRPVYLTRDWHPADHCSFEAQGGRWPPHCVAGTPGAKFSDALQAPRLVRIVSKATGRDADAYSGFDRTDLARRLASRGITRVVVGGLATDYCVLATVLDARKAGLAVVVLEHAVRAVNVAPEDGREALARMREAGAVFVTDDQS